MEQVSVLAFERPGEYLSKAHCKLKGPGAVHLLQPTAHPVVRQPQGSGL